MSLLRWDPFAELTTLRDAMDRLYDDSFVRPTRFLSGRVSGVRALPLDLYETNDAIIVKAPVPGVKPEDVEISIDQGLLTIRGHMFSEAEREEAKQYTWYCHEMGHGDFARSIALASPVDANKAEATYENGVLTLTIPKAEEAKPKQIKVKMASALEAHKD